MFITTANVGKASTSWLDWLSYPRAVFYLVWGLVHTMICSIFFLFVGAFTRSRKALEFIIRQLWSWPLLFFVGIRTEVRGREHIKDSKNGFLILFNHSSLMDIPILFYFFPRSFQFGAKIELFRLPFFGQAMKVAGVLPIDRGNRAKVMKVYEQAMERVEKGECFALAPEGTRQHEPRLGPFKKGPFEFAINAQMDIVPVVLVGAYEVLSKSSIFAGLGRWRHPVVMEITPPVSTKKMSLSDLDALQAKVREQMEQVFSRHHQALFGY